MAKKMAVKHPGSDMSLSIGFLSCLFLTVGGYTVAQTNGLSLNAKIGIIAGLAFAQFVIQMIFFLHLGRERKPKWKLWMFFSMVIVVLILVIGSLWIMHNLDYNMMNFTRDEQTTYLKNHEGL